MKKTLIFASMAVAGAFALHADWTCQNWFKGIGASPTATDLPSSLNPVNGLWAKTPATSGGTFAGTLDWSGNALVFDLDDGEHLDFTIGSAAAADTDTVTDVEVTGVFTPVTGDLPDDPTMNGRSAQVGFVVAIDGNATNYCAWTGSGWVALTNEAVDAGENIDQETSLLVRFDYRSSPTASFAILKTVSSSLVTNFLGNSAGLVALPITATVVTRQESPVRAVSGVSCYGSGTLAKADGGVGLGVASVASVKYGSLQDAAAAAGVATGDKTITVLQTTTESVTLPDGVVIYDPDKKASGANIAADAGATVTIKPIAAEVNSGASGSCTVPLNITLGNGSKVEIDLSSVAPGKEVVGDVNVEGTTATFTTRTAKSVLTAATVGGKNLNLSDSAKEDALRALLNTYANSAYTQAYASTEAANTAIQTALLATPANSANSLALWQDYALGIQPTDPVKPVAAPVDSAPNAVTLSIPALVGATASGDFAIKYQIDSNTAAALSGGAISVPLPSSVGGEQHTVKIVFE